MNRRARWYVITGDSYTGWAVEARDGETAARQLADNWARQGKVTTLVQEVATYRPASTVEEPSRG